MKRFIPITCVLLLLGFYGQSQGLVGRLKQKAQQLGEKSLDKKVEEKTGLPTGEDNSGSSSSSSEDAETSVGDNGTPTNKGGGGLVSTPPDVNKNIADAKSAYGSENYSQAKYSVQQAMLGVELEIGHQVLESFPTTVAGLPVKTDADQVTSTGFGWAGLTIHREYLQGDKDVQVTVANNAAWMSAVNVYLSNPGYASTDQNWKQVTFQDNRGILEYSDSEGYKLSLPIGQTSLIIWQGINFASEDDFINALGDFNVANIKQQLGEQ